jgi:hypothetical protein
MKYSLLSKVYLRRLICLTFLSLYLFQLNGGVSAASTICYPTPVPFVFGGNGGDTKIYALDVS